MRMIEGRRVRGYMMWVSAGEDEWGVQLGVTVCRA